MDNMTILLGIFAMTVALVAALDLLFVTPSNAPVPMEAALRWSALWVAEVMGFVPAAKS